VISLLSAVKFQVVGVIFVEYLLFQDETQNFCVTLVFDVDPAPVACGSVSSIFILPYLRYNFKVYKCISSDCEKTIECSSFWIQLTNACSGERNT